MKKTTQVLTGLLAIALLAAFVRYNSSEARQSRELRPSRLAGGNERDGRVIGEADLEKLYPNVVLRAGKGPARQVALTFDDGPDKVYTPVVLDILRQKGIKATFFLIGKRIQENPDTVRRIASEGHLIGNHTYSHAQLTASGPDVEREISRMEETLKPYGLLGNNLFRPAYGAVNPSLVVQVSDLGYRVALWSVDSLDWQGLSSAEVRRNVEGYVSPGSVILFHSAGGPGEDLSGSVEALPYIIDNLKAAGYDFVTVAEMFSLDIPSP